MKSRRCVLIAAFLLAPACSSTSDESEELYLPSEAEAQARADAEISDENADEEFERLMEEIEDDTAK